MKKTPKKHTCEIVEFPRHLRVREWTMVEHKMLRNLASVLIQRRCCLEYDEGADDEGNPWFALVSPSDGFAFSMITKITEGHRSTYMIVGRDGRPQHEASDLKALLAAGFFGGDEKVGINGAV